MCEECNLHRLGPSLTSLRKALAELDTKHEYAAAALVAHAIEIIERKSKT